MGNVWIALGLTVFAGLATAIGSGIALLARRTNTRFLSVSTGFSAGVLVYVSLLDILDKGFNCCLVSGWSVDRGVGRCMAG